MEGSKTAERGRLAQIQMIGDMVELCDMIYDCGIRSPDGRAAISFGDAFRVSLVSGAPPGSAQDNKRLQGQFISSLSVHQYTSLKGAL